MKDKLEPDPFIYDARLTAIDHTNRVLFFDTARQTHRIPYEPTTHWALGAVGRLRLPSSAQGFAFHQYPDPLLRRLPELDELSTQRWGWRLGERRFTVAAGILPGRGGAVVPRDTERFALELPREFLDLCSQCHLSPDTVLLGYVADLCSLHNWHSCPREDHYSSNGSDERQMAKQYFFRAYGWVFYADEANNSRGAGNGETSHG